MKVFMIFYCSFVPILKNYHIFKGWIEHYKKKPNVMGKIISIIEQVINSKDIGAVIGGLLLIVCGIAIGVFKQTWLIAGSTFLAYMKEEAENYVAIFVGLFIGLLGGIMFLGVFICTYFEITEYSHNSALFMVLFALLLAFLGLFLIVKIKNYKGKKNHDKDIV